MSSREIFNEDWRTKKNEIAYLDVINIVDKHWFDEFRHTQDDYKSNCRLVAWSNEDDLKELLALSYGYYPDNYNLKDDFKLHSYGGCERAR